MAQNRRAPPAVEKPAADAPGSSVRTLKKYPNRRLYDTHTSSYITLVDVKKMVLGGQAFIVRDAKTGEDLTRSILLQIILEEEAGGAPMFSEVALANIIRFYGHSAQGFMGTYLEKNVQAFTDLQKQLAEQSRNVTPEMWSQFMNVQNPMVQGMMGSYLEKNIQTFTEIQSRLGDPAKGFSPELWTQFLNGQAPMVQGLMGNYLEQSKNLFVQMQEQMAEQAKSLFPGLPGFLPPKR